MLLNAQKQRQRRLHGRPSKCGKFIKRLYDIVNRGAQVGVQPRSDRQGFNITNLDLFRTKTLPFYYKYDQLSRFYNELKDYYFERRKDHNHIPSFSALHFNLDDPKYKIKKKSRVNRQEQKEMYWPVQVIMNNNDQENNTTKNHQDYDEDEESSILQKSPFPSANESNGQNPQNNLNRHHGPFDNLLKQYDDPQMTSMLENLGHLQVEEDMLEAEVQYLKDSKVKQRIDQEEILSSGKSAAFKFYYFQSMQQYKMKQLSLLMNFLNASEIQKRPFKDYIDAYRYTQPFSSIDYQVIKKSTREIFWDCNFAQNALELEHSKNPVDFDKFFEHDWKQFEIMRFSHCNLYTVDWVKFCNHAKENLPNLKLIYFDNNLIKFVKKSDFEQFPSLQKIDLRKNPEINALCEKEIIAFLEKNRSVIIERD